MRVENRIEIAAPIARVWELTLDAEAWPAFTPTITSIEWLSEPPVKVGSTARIKQAAQPDRVWTVTALETESCFAWATRAMGVTMTGSHHLAASETGTTNTLTVDIEGLLAPLIGLLLRRPIRNAIAAENAGFKAAAEIPPESANRARS
ncbi:MAG: SRPBCC family protein [Planctomycetota bacterium]